MTADLVAFLRARLDEDEEVALGVVGVKDANGHRRDGRTIPRWEQEDDAAIWTMRDGHQVPAVKPTWRREAVHICRWDPARVLAEVDAKRRVLALHEPQWEMVEWPDDQNGKGFAWVCCSCGNRDLDGWRNWRPLVGEAGWFPEGVKPPYIVAPCETLRLLALPYREHPDYRPEWAPEA